MKKICLYICLLIYFAQNIYADEEWTYITEINGKKIVSVACLETCSDGTAWIVVRFIGENEDTVLKFDGTNWNNESENLGSVQDIDATSNGDVWFSCFSFLAKYSSSGWEYYTPDPAILPNPIIHDISVDAHGTVWGVAVGGIFKFDGTTWQLFTTEDGLCHPYILFVSVSPGGDVWCRYGDPFFCDSSEACSYYGVSHYTGEKWITYDISSGLLDNDVADIAFGQDGTVYISYGNVTPGLRGISKYDGTVWTTISNTQTGMLFVDENGLLWTTWTSEGEMFSFDGNNWTKYAEMPEDAQEFNWGDITIDTLERLWIAVNHGFLIFDHTAVSVVQSKQKPQNIHLFKNYPNPFNPSTTIHFAMNNPSHVTLSVYSITGQKVATLIDGSIAAGSHKVVFDGSGLGSGMYFYRFETPGVMKTGKMLLMK